MNIQWKKNNEGEVTPLHSRTYDRVAVINWYSPDQDKTESKVQN